MDNILYQELSLQEKRILIGKITHLIQSDEKFFLFAKNIIQSGEDAGFFKGIQILPENDFLTETKPIL